MPLQNTKTAVFAAVLIVPFAALAKPTLIEVGDGKIDGNKIEPYEFTWHQCSMQENTWVDGGTLVEKTVEENESGRRVLRHEQTTTRPNGVRSVAITWFDRDSLAPLRMQATHYGSDGNTLASNEFLLNEKGYKGSKTRGEQTENVSGEVSSTQYHGMAFGLPFATLDLPGDLPVEVPASMISFDATYTVIATLGGQEKMTINGKTVDAYYVDVEWHHLGLGDVYPPGPDASGGRYWVVNNPPEGVPYVPRYKTDTYAVEVVPSVCPTDLK